MDRIKFYESTADITQKKYPLPVNNNLQLKSFGQNRITIHIEKSRQHRLAIS